MAEVGSFQPERESLRFHYDGSSVPPEMDKVMAKIKRLSEKLLYHWKTFPIVLPEPLTRQGEEREDKLDFRNLFIAPTFDELEQVATDERGDLRKLSDAQLQSIWNTGEFDVASINFPGQFHRWRLTQLLQKGSKKAHDTLFSDLAKALQLLIITAKNRISSPFFSLSESIRSWGRGLWKILDIVIGMPSTSPSDLESKIHWEHMRYLVAELDVKSSSRPSFSKFCSFVKEKSRQSKTSEHKDTILRPPPIPYIYQTPKGLDIDLRLFNKDLINNCLPVLSNILDRESRGWYIAFRQKLLMDLKGQGLSTEELSKRVNEAVMREYLQRVFTAILNNAELESLESGIGELLVSQAKSVLVMEKATVNIQKKMSKHKDQLLAHLVKAYPVKSRISAWVNEQLTAFEREFVSQNLWSSHEEAIGLCEEENLQQSIYFLRRDLNFIKEREDILIKELSRIKIPNRIFTFSMRVWLPKNWVTMGIVDNDQMVLPTIIGKKGSATRSTKLDLLERAGVLNLNLESKHSATRYYVNKYSRRKTSTRYPFWRWWNYLHRTWTWTWNSIFFFGIVVPWCSPLSLRSLFFCSVYKPDLEISQHDGKLYPSDSSKTHTLVSRLRALWSHVFASRDKFEDAPDRGFLGKSFTRHLNRFWNFVVKGVFGSILLVLVFPVLCVVVSGLSLAMGLTAPAWAPFVTLLAHVFAITVFDFDYPGVGYRVSGLLEAILWRLLIQGSIQPVCAVLVSCIGCPLAAMFISLFGVIRRSGRGLWDTFMYQAVIKSRGRVPAKDGFVARRIAGPGLASNYFLQIHPEQALAALEATMEADELEMFKSKTLKIIDQPTIAYRKFVEQCFKPFSADTSAVGVYKQLLAETSNYTTDLANKVGERQRQLNTGLHPELQRKIKLPEKQLKITILHAAKMMEAFYPEHVISQSSHSEEMFWEFRQLEFRDWTGLASQKLSQIFSEAFLVPLEDTDSHFQLQVEHINLGRYINMLNTADFHDDLDLVTEVHTPTGDITTRPPSLDGSYFNPAQKIIHTQRFPSARARRYPWKRARNEVVFDKLEVPLPIPHPAVIAVSIYNRLNEQDTLSFDDQFCTNLIKATKALAHMDILDPAMTDSHEMDTSTPENGIEPVSVISHLAEQEHSISDDNNTATPSSPNWDNPTPVFERRIETFVDDANDDDTEADGQVFYSEEEANTSCVVVNMPDTEEEEEEEDLRIDEVNI